MMTDLPYGRGARAGTDNYVGQTESYALRERALTPSVGNVVSTARMLAHSIPGVSSNVAANYIFFAPLQVEPHNVVVSEARVNVSLGQPSASFEMALYVLSADSVSVLRKIDPSYVKFDATVTGRKALALPSSVTLAADRLHFIAMLQINNSSVGCVNLFNASTTLFRFRYLFATTFPDTVDLSALPLSSLQQMPFVAYLSPGLTEVL